MRKTMKQIRTQKMERMKKLLDAIKEHPRTSEELQNILKDVHRQNIHNYLIELRGLGLITYDEGKYWAIGSRKKEYASKHDYNVALKHSKKLVFTDDYVQRFDGMDPALAIDLLAFGDFDTELPLRVDESLTMPGFIKLFEQHLKTGYYEGWSILKEYREKMREAGYADRLSLPKLGNPLADRFGEPEKSPPSELIALQKGLIGEIYFIVSSVSHGIPLKGYCDHCPDRALTIKK